MRSRCHMPVVELLDPGFELGPCHIRTRVKSQKIGLKAVPVGLKRK